MRVSPQDGATPIVTTADAGEAATAATAVVAATDQAAVVVQEGNEPAAAVAAALDEAGLDPDQVPPDLTIVEVAPPAGDPDGERMFIVLWGRVARALTWLDEVADASVASGPLRPELMSGVLAAGNMAFGMPDAPPDAPYPTLARWLAVASPSRAAWDALDRFFLGKQESTVRLR